MSGKNIYPVYLQFWMWWLILTIIYLVPIFLDFLAPYLMRPTAIFVPFGFMDLASLFSGNKGALVSIGLVFLCLFFVDKISFRLGIKSIVFKIFFNLLILFILTYITDRLIWHTWASFSIFLDGHIPESLSRLGPTR